MKDGVGLVLPLSLGAAAVICAAGLLGDPQFVTVATGQAGEEKAEKSGSLPPLVVGKDAPQLLDGPPQEKEAVDVPKGPVADNTACYVCHDNYKEEPLAAVHAKEDVGCVKCHGKSYDHRNDEDNVTPPDIMYPPEKIAANCRECHDSHDVSATEVIARWQERSPAKTNPKKIVCTDCHGEHRLKLRSVRWDKRTRKLIIREKDQQIKTGAESAGLLWPRVVVER